LGQVPRRNLILRLPEHAHSQDPGGGRVCDPVGQHAWLVREPAGGKPRFALLLAGTGDLIVEFDQHISNRPHLIERVQPLALTATGIA